MNAIASRCRPSGNLLLGLAALAAGLVCGCGESPSNAPRSTAAARVDEERSLYIANLVLEGKRETAYEACRNYLDADPGSVVLRLQLASLSTNAVEAAAHYRKVVDMDPASPYARAAWEQMVAVVSNSLFHASDADGATPAGSAAGRAELRAAARQIDALAGALHSTSNDLVRARRTVAMQRHQLDVLLAPPPAPVRAPLRERIARFEDTPPGSPGTNVADSAAPDGTRVYTVKKGDSLWSISERMYGDPSKIPLLRAANPKVVARKDTLREGEKIIIPALPSPSANATPDSAAAPVKEGQ